MEMFEKPDFFGDVEAEKLVRSYAEKLAQSYPNPPPNYSMDESLFDHLDTTMGTQFNQQQYGQAGGTSTEAHKRPSIIYSAPQGSDMTKNNLPRTTSRKMPTDRVAKKRLNDKAYRDRMRQDKIRMKRDLGTIHDENANLKKENKRLQHENSLMNETLQTQPKLIERVKSDFDKLNYEYKKQNALVQRLSELLACRDLQLENERLKFENDQLRRNTSMDFTKLLAVENANLKLENKVLKVQNDALCGKLINDSDKKCV